MKILTTVSFAFEKTRAKRVPFFALAFGVWGFAQTRHRVGILNGSEKVPCVSLLYAFKPLNFSL